MQAKRSPESCISSKLSSNSQRVGYKPSRSLGRCKHWYREPADGETLLSPVSPTNLGASTYGAKTLSLARITIGICEHRSTFSGCAEGQHQETRKPRGLSSRLKDISVHVFGRLSQRIALLCKRHTRHSPDLFGIYGSENIVHGYHYLATTPGEATRTELGCKSTTSRLSTDRLWGRVS